MDKQTGKHRSAEQKKRKNESYIENFEELIDFKLDWNNIVYKNAY